MTSSAKTIDEYLTELAEERREALEVVRGLIHKVVPDVEEGMKYGLPSFGDICALASQKGYMSLYVCEGDLVKAYLPKLGKVSCGKGCIRFKKIEDLNLDAVEGLLREIDGLRRKGIPPACR